MMRKGKGETPRSRVHRAVVIDDARPEIGERQLPRESAQANGGSMIYSRRERLRARRFGLPEDLGQHVDRLRKKRARVSAFPIVQMSSTRVVPSRLRRSR